MNGNDYRAASGLATYPGVNGDGPAGPGLFEVTTEGPGGTRERMITNVRRIAGADRTPGSALIGTAGWLLLALAAGVMAVSFAGQFAYLDAARHQAWAANIESAMFDAGMIILSMLALGMSMAGKPSRTERVLIMACAAGSAAMGYAAADVTSPRSVAAFVAPPLFLAVLVDRVIAVVRRHVLGDDETSPWVGLGRVVLALLRLGGVVVLYSLRWVLAPPSTTKGLRQVVLNAAPLPSAVLPAVLEPVAVEPPKTKKEALLRAYRAHPEYGVRAAGSRVAGELAAQAELQPGTARTYVLAELASMNGEAS